MKKKTWNVCQVNGYITASDPGRLTTSCSHKTYKKSELWRGMNLCGYDEDLPKVILKEIGEDYIVVNNEGCSCKVEIGKHVETPRKGLSYAWSDASISIDTMGPDEAKERMDRVTELYDQMLVNWNELGEPWKNIPLVKEAFEIMCEIPDIVEDVFDTKKEKAKIMDIIASYIEETLTPRFFLEMCEFIKGLDPDLEENLKLMEYLSDFINPDMTMEEFCNKYEKTLKFDPVERSEKWEKVIYDVELECAEILKDEPRGMGFCFSYWSTKAAVLAKHGITWKSPSVMNPGVMFD